MVVVFASWRLLSLLPSRCRHRKRVDYTFSPLAGLMGFLLRVMHVLMDAREVVLLLIPELH